MDSEVLVKVEGVSKKFCRSLKKSLWYGLQDMAAEAFGGNHRHEQLRESEFWAVNDVSFELRRGECLGFVGRNGAGKTTLLKMLNGLIKPDKGKITMRGRVGALIALGAGFNPILTGRENIYVNGSILGLSQAEIESKMDDIIDFADIREFIDSPVQSYSSGMQVRLGFAVAASLEPNVLILDEVLAVGDVDFQAKCFNRLGELRRKGVAFIFVSHSMHQISRFCEQVLFLKHGQIAYLGQCSKALELYSQDMHLETLTTQESGDTHTEQAGSLKVEFEEVFFTNDKGECVRSITSNAPISLNIRYKCHVDSVVNPILELGLRDQTGEALFHGSTKMEGVKLGELKGRGSLVVRFAHMPANNLTITAAISLWNSDMLELICWHRGTKLVVKGNPQSIGRINLSSEWLHLQGAEAEKQIVNIP